MLYKAYLAFGVACLTWYGASSLFGWEFGNPRRYHAPLILLAPGPRGPGTGYVGRSPGGSSSSHTGTTGFGGGK